MIKHPTHRPPHIFQINKIYFLTGKTYKSIAYFNTPSKKKLLIKTINIAAKKFSINIFAWVILDNHYHLLFSMRENNLLKFAKNIHTNSSRLLKQYWRELSLATPNIPIWYQYFDRIIRSEKDFWTRFNYIHNNPIKHNYIKNAGRLSEYKFSSYNQWIAKNGEEWMLSYFSKYPVIDFSFEEISE